MQNFIQTYHNVLSDQQCDQIIRLHQHNLKLSQSGARTPVHHHAKYDCWYWLRNPLKPQHHGLYDSVTAVVWDLILEYQKSVPESFFWRKDGILETWKVKSYDPTQDQSFPTHQDTLDPSTVSRFLAILFYLNDSDAGTHFPYLDHTVPARKGSAVLFPPYWLFPHEGQPPRIETKYILNTYLCVPLAK